MKYPIFFCAFLFCGLFALSATPVHAQFMPASAAAPGTVVGTDSDGDGLWDDDYALFIYAMGAKGSLRPDSVGKSSASFIKDWRRHAGLPTWNKLNPDQRAYFSSWFWTYQELLAAADNPARTLELEKNRAAWIGCYQPLRLPLKQMIGIGPFLQQVMLGRMTEARSKAEIKVSNNVGSQAFELAVPESVEACRALFEAMPFKAYPVK